MYQLGDDCLVNVLDGYFILSYNHHISKETVTLLGGQMCPLPRIAAPPDTVIRDAWLTPNDPDRSMWEDWPLTGKLDITPGLIKRLHVAFNKHLWIRLRTKTQDIMGRTAATLDRLQYEQRTKLQVEPLAQSPMKQSTIGQYFTTT